jgi:hypothetical protein
VRHPENSLRGVEVCLEQYSISERDSAEAAMQDAAWRALSHYCLVLGGVADGLNLRYYPRRPSGSTGGVVVSPAGEDNPRLSSTVVGAKAKMLPFAPGPRQSRCTNGGETTGGFHPSSTTLQDEGLR